MGRNLTDIVASLPADEQEAVKARCQESKQEVEVLELGQIAEKPRADTEAKLNIRQPSISKIDGQVDIYLSKPQRYVEAIDGKLKLTVALSSRPLPRLQCPSETAAGRAVGSAAARNNEGMPSQQ